MVVSGDGESRPRHLRAELPGVLGDVLDEGVVRLQHVEHLARAGHDGRGQRVGEEVRPGPLPQQVHHLLGGGRVPAGGAAHRLAQGRVEQVHLASRAHPEEGLGAAAAAPEEAGGVTVVHEHEGVVPDKGHVRVTNDGGYGAVLLLSLLLCEVADVAQGGDVAVHGEDAVGGDHPGATGLALH